MMSGDYKRFLFSHLVWLINRTKKITTDIQKRDVKQLSCAKQHSEPSHCLLHHFNWFFFIHLCIYHLLFLRLFLCFCHEILAKRMMDKKMEQAHIFDEYIHSPFVLYNTHSQQIKWVFPFFILIIKINLFDLNFMSCFFYSRQSFVLFCH